MLSPPRVRSALFGEDSVVRKGAAERPDDSVFGFVVGLGDQVERVDLTLDLAPT
jgi:hypothetical protein